MFLNSLIIWGLLFDNAYAASPQLKLTSSSRLRKNRYYNIYVKLYPKANKICSFRTNVILPNKYLRISSITTANKSIYTLENKYSNSTGKISFAGGIPKCTTSDTTVLKIRVKALRTTSRAKISYLTTEIYNSSQKSLSHSKYTKTVRIVK